MARGLVRGTKRTCARTNDVRRRAYDGYECYVRKERGQPRNECGKVNPYRLFLREVKGRGLRRDQKKRAYRRWRAEWLSKGDKAKCLDARNYALAEFRHLIGRGGVHAIVTSPEWQESWYDTDNAPKGAMNRALEVCVNVILRQGILSGSNFHVNELTPATVKRIVNVIDELYLGKTLKRWLAPMVLKYSTSTDPYPIGTPNELQRYHATAGPNRQLGYYVPTFTDNSGTRRYVFDATMVVPPAGPEQRDGGDTISNGVFAQVDSTYAYDPQGYIILEVNHGSNTIVDSKFIDGRTLTEPHKRIKFLVSALQHELTHVLLYRNYHLINDPARAPLQDAVFSAENNNNVQDGRYLGFHSEDPNDAAAMKSARGGHGIYFRRLNANLWGKRSSLTARGVPEHNALPDACTIQDYDVIGISSDDDD